METCTYLSVQIECSCCSNPAPSHKGSTMFKWLMRDEIIGAWHHICKECADKPDDDSSQKVWYQDKDGIAHSTVMVNGKRTIEL